MNKKRYITDTITREQLQYGKFNIIASGTGTGKTEFVRNGLLNMFPEIKPSEVLYVTSRSIIRDQQAELDGIQKLNDENRLPFIRYWNGETGDIVEYDNNSICILNINDMVTIIDRWASVYAKTLSKIKIAVFDEAHALVNDEFITGIIAIRMWIRERANDKSVLLIGLTATPAMLLDENNRFNYSIGISCPDYIVNYKAKNLICTTYNRFFELYDERFVNSKSIILCNTYKDFAVLKKRIPKSAVLCSQHSDIFTDEMDALRNYIIEHKKLPDDVDVLITTSALREGFNIDEHSGIKNVICFSCDEMTVVQFAGRCRFNIENLVIAYKSGAWISSNRHTRVSSELYLRYIDDPTDRSWFSTIEKIVSCDFADVERYLMDTDECTFDKEFQEYVGVPIVSDNDKQAIIELVDKYGMLGDSMTFLAACRAITRRLGYTLKTKSCRMDGHQRTVKYFIRNEGCGHDETGNEE